MKYPKTINYNCHKVYVCPICKEELYDLDESMFTCCPRLQCNNQKCKLNGQIIFEDWSKGTCNTCKHRKKRLI